MAGILDSLIPNPNRNLNSMYQAGDGSRVDFSPKSMARGALTQGPVASGLGVANSPYTTTQQKVGGGLGAGLGAIAGLTLPGAGPLGILGAMLNGMGAYHDVNDPENLSGNMSLTPDGILSGSMNAPGGYFNQTGSLNNYNTLNTAPENTKVNMYSGTDVAETVDAPTAAARTEYEMMADTMDSGDGEGGEGGSVLCTALHYHGLMADDVFKADTAHGRKLPTDVIAGYHSWAKPIARKMKKRRWLAQVLEPLITPWAIEMAHREGVRDKGHIIGKIYMAIGVPACSFIGKIKCLRFSIA